MKREIKFRLWNGKDSFCTEEHVKCNLFNYLKFNPEYVQQYTGLKDKNGVEIYEGDIVKISGHTYGDNFICQITEKRGGFWADRDYLGNWKEYMLEVIGNIYQNPELLNEK